MAKAHVLSLGLSLGQRNGAAVLLRDSQVVAAALEPRRQGRSPTLPLQAVEFCLRQAGLKDLTGVNMLGMQSRFATDWADFLATQFSAEKGWIEGLLTFPSNLRQELRFRAELRQQLENLIAPTAPLPELTLVADELALAQGLYASSADRPVAVLVMDVPFAKQATGLWVAREQGLEQVWVQEYPQSLELFVHNLAAFSGFRGRMGQRQFLQLAEYGENRYFDVFENELLKIGDDGRFTLNVDVLVMEPNEETEWKELSRLIGSEARDPKLPISSREIDLAHALIHVVTQWGTKLSTHVREELKVQKLIVRANGPLAERVRSPWRRSVPSFETRFSPTAEEPLIMAAGAAIEALATQQIFPARGQALNLRAMQAFRQYGRPVSPTVPTVS